MEINTWALIITVLWTILMGMYISPKLVNRRLFKMIESGEMADTIAAYMQKVLQQEVQAKGTDGKMYNVRLFDLLLHSSYDYMQKQISMAIQSNKGHMAKKMQDPVEMLDFINNFLPEKYQGVQHVAYQLMNQQTAQKVTEGTAGGNQTYNYL